MIVLIILYSLHIHLAGDNYVPVLGFMLNSGKLNGDWDTIPALKELIG